MRPTNRSYKPVSPSVNRIIGAPEGQSLIGHYLREYVSSVGATAQSIRYDLEMALSAGENVVRRLDFIRADGSKVTILESRSRLVHQEDRMPRYNA